MRLLLILCLFIFLGMEDGNAQNNTNMRADLKKLIEKKRKYNKEYGFGYRVQLYYGREIEARKIEQQFKLEYPKIYTKLNYEQPYWKVQVGNYKTKLEADQALLKFSKNFNNLIVVPLGK